MCFKLLILLGKRIKTLCNFGCCEICTSKISMITTKKYIQSKYNFQTSLEQTAWKKCIYRAIQKGEKKKHK